MSVAADNGILDTDAAKRLVSYIERIERLEEEKTTLSQDIKSEFDAAKGDGFDPKIMKQILRLRKRSADEIQEEEALLECYRSALNMV